MNYLNAMASPHVNGVCLVYTALTTMKVLQLFLHYSKPRNKTSKEKMEYNSSMGSFFFVLDTFSGERPASKIPRQEFKQITDPMFHEYIATYSQRKGKTFDSLISARRNCFAEFIQDTGYWVDFGNRVSDFLRQPLGLVWFVTFLQFLSMFLVLLFREIFCLGASSKSCIAKVAASVTLTEIYVVCCKEKITFNEAIWKYSWSHSTFNKIAPHPLIGVNVCPLYKKEFIWPNDTMNFDIEVISVPTGNAILKQKYEWFIVENIMRLRLSHVLVFGMFGFLGILYGIPAFISIAPSAGVFYSVRTIVDKLVGTRWRTYDL